MALSKKEAWKLSAVFAVIYFFSTNGLAALPGMTMSFLLKDVLGMTATQAAYFGAIAVIGWAIKPIWGVLSDSLPLFGLRRKPYLVLGSLGTMIIWLLLGQMQSYNVMSLILLFALSSTIYSLLDVVCDALMVEKGKPHGLTGRFQSVQWTAVYIAAVIASLLGGWAAEHLRPQTVFLANGLFPLIILAFVLIFIREERAAPVKNQLALTRQALGIALRRSSFWILAAFLFFWTFSPSIGTPFFYYAVDELRFDKIFLGIVGAVGSGAGALGALIFWKYSTRLKTRMFVKLMIIVGVAATLFNLVYFAPFIQENLIWARVIYISTSAILGIVSSLTFLVLMNAAALATEEWGEGTTFAFLTTFWNIGLIGSGLLGGFLFAKIGLPPLIIISTVFTALTWLFLPYLKFGDEPRPKKNR